MGNKQCGGLAVVDYRDAYCARSLFDPFFVKDLEEYSLNVGSEGAC